MVRAPHALFSSTRANQATAARSKCGYDSWSWPVFATKLRVRVEISVASVIEYGCWIRIVLRVLRDRQLLPVRCVSVGDGGDGGSVQSLVAVRTSLLGF